MIFCEMDMMRRYFLVAIVLFFSIDARTQDRIPAFEMNERLGRGVNMGNSFEAPTESGWGNPWDPEYFKIMADLGFDHVRLPVRWETEERSMSTPPYTITPSFLERIQEVVDEALKNKLHIIVNMHHHEALFENPESEKARFISQWNQIADYFKDYPDSLLFEVLNEPHGNISPEMWNEYFADALVEIRKTNPTRVVIMGVAEYGGLGGIVHLNLPNDEYIILSPHYYNPFQFTHQGAEWVGENADEWLGTKWYDTEAERETVENEFHFALQYSEDNNIPIHVGEFGAYSKADIESRERWTTFLSRWFEQQNLSWAYWEFSAGFGIYNPDTEELLDPLVDALLHNEMPEPTPIVATPIYTSDFSDGVDGWTLNTSNGASGSLTATDGQLNVSISNGGMEAWHVQLMKTTIALEQDKMYRVSFKTKSSENRSATYYIGKASDPWNAYSGYNGISLSTDEVSHGGTFIMDDPSDPAARFVMDLGNSTVGIPMWDVKVELLEFKEEEVITAIEEVQNDIDRLFYPNPTRGKLNLINPFDYFLIQIYDQKGRLVHSLNLVENQNAIDIGHLPTGMYLINASGSHGNKHFKIIKE